MPRQAALKLDAMTVSQLLQLRDRVQTALSGKIELERADLQRKIDELSTLETSASGNGRSERRSGGAGRRTGDKRAGNGKTQSLKGRSVVPKYRDPNHPDQTWAGRGQAPRWLTAYENEGRKRQEFLIGAASGRSEVRLSRAGRRAGGKRGGNGKSHPLKGRTVAAKYRDHANPDQTWAGRGQAPRWLVAYEAAGRKRDEFLIGATARVRTKGRGKK